MSEQYFGLYRGTVVNNNDPDGTMRIMILIPEVLGNTPSDWALPCVPPGVRLVPDIDTLVWVEFEGGDPSRPVWVGTAGGPCAGVVMKGQIA